MSMTLQELLTRPSDLADAGTDCPVVLMTRVRLARNLAHHAFPGHANKGARQKIFEQCRQALVESRSLRQGLVLTVEEMTPLQRQILVERHLISRELSGGESGAGVIVNKEQNISVMINEEDHLRIQVLRAGFQFRRAWASINRLDTKLEESLDFAFSPELGYLTACPTNLGTGLRVSAMMHLPALVIAGQMEKVVRAVNQLGMVVRGMFGEGSDASGSMFQISNQTTLGEAEPDIVKRLQSVLESIIEHELNAREKLLETEPHKLPDKIGRAFGVLQHGHTLSSGEAMNLLSLVRLGVDLGCFPVESRPVIDRLLIEAQPGHVHHASGLDKLESKERDVLRATQMRSEFANFPTPAHIDPTHN